MALHHIGVLAHPRGHDDRAADLIPGYLFSSRTSELFFKFVALSPALRGHDSPATFHDGLSTASDPTYDFSSMFVEAVQPRGNLAKCSGWATGKRARAHAELERP